MAIITKNILTIGEYFENSKLHIPEFQRPYKWTVKNVIQLMDDIERFKSDEDVPYRIGTIVIYQENNKNEFNIVDGQQRTITLLLMLKAIYTNCYNSIKSTQLKEQLNKVINNSFTPAFKSEISHKNIQDNYREIERRVGNIDESFINFLINKCQITHFIIDDISEAFQFFDSQNARGKDLEPHDLLKAFHLRELKKSNDEITEKQIAELVDTWEEMDIHDLSKLFSDFLYRVRGWSKGNSSRYFTKSDTPLFKGINLANNDSFPYSKIYKIVDTHLKTNSDDFPFQLDQTIINGKYFFEMITHYKNIFDKIKSNYSNLTKDAQDIIKTLDTYAGRNRTGDEYVRMLFNCSLLYYVDKFGEVELSKAVEKLFIWAYSIRLTYQSLQLASVDNYVVNEFNIFKKIREAIYKEDILTIELPLIYTKDEFQSEKTEVIRKLFIKMKYYGDVK